MTDLASGGAVGSRCWQQFCRVQLSIGSTQPRVLHQCTFSEDLAHGEVQLHFEPDAQELLALQLAASIRSDDNDARGNKATHSYLHALFLHTLKHPCTQLASDHQGKTQAHGLAVALMATAQTIIAMVQVEYKLGLLWLS